MFRASVLRSSREWRSLYLLRPGRRRLLSMEEAAATKKQERADRIVSRRACPPFTTSKAFWLISVQYIVPNFLQKYTAALRNAPVSHITSFLLLHEITAVTPLLAFVAYFHYTNWLPPYIADWKWVSDGVEKFGRYFRKKGWLD